jgi:succinate dehydrogenase cytochrome b556 subunit
MIKKNRGEELGMWTWLLQRVSGLLLLFYLFLHLWILHYSNLPDKATFDSILMRLQSPFFLIFDLMLLALVIFHGLNGLRVIIIDFGIDTRTQKIVFILLMLMGVSMFLFGVYALWPFITLDNTLRTME